MLESLAYDLELAQRMRNELRDEIRDRARVGDDAPLGIDGWRQQVAGRIKRFGANGTRVRFLGFVIATRPRLTDVLLKKLDAL